MAQKPAAPLPPALEARIAALEAEPPQSDFGAWGWLWMIVLCVILPMGLLVVAWWLIPGRF